MTKIGYKQTNEHKRKISESNKGRVGHKQSEETKRILREKFKVIAKEKGFGRWSKGRNLSEEHKKKISESNKERGKGRHLSETTKIKIGIFNKGRHHSEETKRKMGIAISENSKTNPNSGMKGKHLSEETRKKLRISTIEYIKNTRENIAPNIGRYEKQILDELENRFNYKIVRQFFINGYYLDGYIPELNLAIEIDEEHHYNNGELRERDLDKQNNIINSLNCEFLRIRVSEIINGGELDIEYLNKYNLNCKGVN